MFDSRRCAAEGARKAGGKVGVQRGQGTAAQGRAAPPSTRRSHEHCPTHVSCWKHSEGVNPRWHDASLPGALGSRISYLSEQYAVRFHWIRRFLQQFGIEAGDWMRDCFASPSNARFSKFWTAEQDAIMQDWSSNEIHWCNPPWTIWPSVAEKILSSNCVSICVFPAWHSKQWVQDLVFSAVKTIYLEVGSKIFELGGKAVGGIKWGLYVVLIWPSDFQSINHVSWSGASRRRWRRKQQRDRVAMS